MFTTMALFGLALAAATCCGGEAFAEESTGQIRARLLATRLETDVTVELRNGQKWKGALTDITENHFLLLEEPDKETRKRLRLRAGLKLKKTLAFDDVLTLEGAVAEEMVEKYLVLAADEAQKMQVRLAESGGGVESGALSLSEEREKDLDEWAAKGFRVVPRTLDSSLGRPGVILERASSEPGPRDYRVLATIRKATLETELRDAVARGYGIVGLTTAHQRFALLEARAPSAGTPPGYRLLEDLESNLSQSTKDGYRLVTCSDGERLCVLEETADPTDDETYLFLGTTRNSTLEKELNEAGLRGYRIHPGAFGVEGEGIAITEIFAILEKSGSPYQFAYRAFSGDHTSKVQEEVARRAREGFEVVAMTSGKKDVPGPGLTLVETMTPFDVLVVMERSLLSGVEPSSLSVHAATPSGETFSAKAPSPAGG